MSWNVTISKSAREDLDNFRAYHPDLYMQAYRIARSICEDPESGIGCPRNLSTLGASVWCRNLSLEHRVVYEVFADTVVIAAFRTRVD